MPEIIDPEHQFVQRCDQTAELLEHGGDVQLLDVSRNLRQFLLDAPRLIDIVNKNKLKLRFKVMPIAGYAMLQDEPDAVVLAGAEWFKPHLAAAQEVNVDGLLSHVVGRKGDTLITVKRIIRFVANRAGGAHVDLTNDEERALFRDIETLIERMGLRYVLAQMVPIGWCTLYGARPLYEDVSARLAGI
jgi:hypothetical protein